MLIEVHADRGPASMLLGTFFGNTGTATEEDRANARLAAAAPALLAACQRALAAINTTSDGFDCSEAADECRAAIRLALEGRCA